MGATEIRRADNLNVAVSAPPCIRIRPLDVPELADDAVFEDCVAAMEYPALRVSTVLFECRPAVARSKCIAALLQWVGCLQSGRSCSVWLIGVLCFVFAIPTWAQAALFTAVASGDTAAVATLIAQGADVNARDRYGETPLYFADSAAIAMLLIEHGANVNNLDRHGSGPLATAAMFGDYTVAKLLIAHGASVNAWDDSSRTALYLAGSRSVAALLIAHGANVNAVNDDGTPLVNMAKSDRSGSRAIAALLIAHGANVNAQDRFGRTSLYVAAAEGHLDVAQLLIVHGADVNTQNFRGDTPLMAAAMAGHGAIAALLIDHGADIDVRDRDGRTALDFATSPDNAAVAKLLRVHAVGR